MRLIPKSRRGRLILALGLIGLAGGIVAWWRHNPWPARLAFDPPPGWRGMTFGGDGRSLVFRTGTGTGIEEYELATGRPRPTGAEPPVIPSAFSPDRRSFAGVVDRPDGVQELAWGDAATGAIRGRFPQQTTHIGHPAFAPDGRSIRAVVGDRPDGFEVVTWDLATGAEVHRAAAWVQLGGLPLACSPDGTLLAFADPSGGISLRDAVTGRPLGGPLGSPDLARDQNVRPVFAPDGRTLVLAGRSGRVEVWDVATGGRIRAFDLPFRGMTMLALNRSPDGRTLAASAAAPPPGPPWSWAEGVARWADPSRVRPIRTELVLVDLATGRTLARARGSSYAEFAPDGRTVATADSDGTIALRDAPALPGR